VGPSKLGELKAVVPFFERCDEKDETWDSQLHIPVSIFNDTDR